MLTLHPYDESAAYDCDPWASLPEQLQIYLDRLESYPKLSQLSECDPFADTRFSLEETKGMAEELAQLKLLVSARSLPAPPNFISSSPGEPADEPFGWDGLSEFCSSFAAVLEQGISAGLGIVSVGD